MKTTRFMFVMGALIVLTGCAGGNAIDRAVPQAAFAEAQAPLPPPASPEAAGNYPAPPVEEVQEPDPLFESSGQAALSGQYPNINREPRGATAQLTDEERDALVLQMKALADAHAQGAVSTAEYQRRLAELRLLASTHSQATIAVIER